MKARLQGCDASGATSAVTPSPLGATACTHSRSGPSRLPRVLAAVLLALATGETSVPANAAPAPPADSKPRLIVLTDIGNEPDDSESMVRLLLYADELDLEGLVATTSTWQRDKVHPEMIRERVAAYGQVLPNLRIHSSGYPDARRLDSLIRAGQPAYGMAGVGAGKDTEASRLIIAAVDRPDPRPVWVTLWGGATDLAQALHTVRATRSPEAVARFVSKLRVYSISDQDDAGPWIRANFPSLFWIASIHAFGQYQLSTWSGISGPTPGADAEVVSKPWLAAHIQSKGPLGALYPTPQFIMEGDTGSFLYLIPTGLGSPEHPDWGSWGGRYGEIGPALGLHSDAGDVVKGADGTFIAPNKATIARWRPAFQNDFAARIAWSVAPTFAGANHPPELVLNGVAGQAPIELQACAGQPVKLSAAGSRDPDGDALTFRWWQYREASGGLNAQTVQISAESGIETEVVAPVAVKPSFNVEIPPQTVFHIILEATDSGSPSLTRYRRVLLTVPAGGTPLARTLGCAS